MIGPDSSLFQMLSVPDEGPFLRALLGQPRRANAMLDYAHYLEDRQDRRGEFLRLEHLLSGRVPGADVTPARQARHGELLRALAPFAAWLGVVRQTDRVLNCGLATDQPPVVRFRFRCPRSWEDLRPTPEGGVRHCEGCQRDVYYCDGTEAAGQHARAGYCIAVPRHVTAAVGEELTGHVVGMPDVHALWGERLFGRPSGRDTSS